MYKRQVVTIIILIILAGISINALIGQNGIITRAQQAKENMILAQKREEEQLNEMYEQLEGSNQGIPPEDGTIGDLTNKLQDLQDKFDSMQAEYNNFKTTIANTITEKGVETQSTDTIDVMVENIKKIGGLSSKIHVYYGAKGMPNDATSGSWNLTVETDAEYIYWVFDDSIFSGRSSFKIDGDTIIPEEVLNSGGIYIAQYKVWGYQGKTATLSASNVSTPQSYHRQIVFSL